MISNSFANVTVFPSDDELFDPLHATIEHAINNEHRHTDIFFNFLPTV